MIYVQCIRRLERDRKVFKFPPVIDRDVKSRATGCTGFIGYVDAINHNHASVRLRVNLVGDIEIKVE